MILLVSSYFRGKSLCTRFRSVNSNNKPDLPVSLSLSGLDGAGERCEELEEEAGGKEGEMVMKIMRVSYLHSQTY